MIYKLIMVCFCLLSTFGTPMQASEPVSYDKIALKLIKNASLRITKKHHISHIGTKVAMMDCVEFMGLHFQANRRLSKDEARNIVVNGARDFLADINQNEEIRKYLEIYPFDLQHIEIVIFINTPDNGTSYHPDLAVVAARRNKVTYATNDPQNEYKYKLEEEESFEDAVKILQNQASSNQTK